MTREWLITLEGWDFVDAIEDGCNKYIWRKWLTLKYYKDDEQSYSANIAWMSSGNILVKKATFTTKSELVKDVISKVKQTYRVKEMPHRYGRFWRRLFERRQMDNWANESPEPS